MVGFVSVAANVRAGPAADVADAPHRARARLVAVVLRQRGRALLAPAPSPATGRARGDLGARSAAPSGPRALLALWCAWMSGSCAACPAGGGHGLGWTVVALVGGVAVYGAVPPRWDRPSCAGSSACCAAAAAPCHPRRGDDRLPHAPGVRRGRLGDGPGRTNRPTPGPSFFGPPAPDVTAWPRDPALRGAEGRWEPCPHRPGSSRPPVSGSAGPLIADYLSSLQVERGAARNTLLAYRRDLAGFERFLARAGAVPRVR